MAFVAACYRDIADDAKMEEWKRLETFVNHHSNEFKNRSRNVCRFFLSISFEYIIKDVPMDESLS